MTSIFHIILICTPTLIFTLACVRAESPRSDMAPAASPSVSLTEESLIEAQGDDVLESTRRADRTGRTPDGQPARLSPPEHLRRAGVYMANRAFAEARDHWQALITRYPGDSNVPAALFGIGRSLYQERRYAEALPYFERLEREYITIREGRDGFYFVAPTLLRMNRAADAAARYREYTERFPQGERIEDAYLNVIDSLREAGRATEAIPWVARTRERFAGLPTETNALFARLRLEVAGSDWQSAVRTADELTRMNPGRSVSTNPAEVAYLRAYSLERAGQSEQAIRAYQAIPDKASSYYGSLATTRLLGLGGAARRAATTRSNSVRSEIASAANLYPAPHRETILRAVAGRRVDPRLMLSIMRQESGFNPQAKSGAAARGLMQFTTDTAAKYATRAQINNLQEDDLYRPEVSIRLASVYLDELAGLFPNLPEAVAASYNGGEDNVARWLARAGHRDPGVFTAEVGFSETKDYVAKVMANYRAYRQLYTEDLRRR